MCFGIKLFHYFHQRLEVLLKLTLCKQSEFFLKKIPFSGSNVLFSVLLSLCPHIVFDVNIVGGIALSK